MPQHVLVVAQQEHFAGEFLLGRGPEEDRHLLGLPSPEGELPRENLEGRDGQHDVRTCKGRELSPDCQYK